MFFSQLNIEAGPALWSWVEWSRRPSEVSSYLNYTVTLRMVGVISCSTGYFILCNYLYVCIYKMYAEAAHRKN